ncbi:MAG: ABC transporter permease [Clostridiales Family XIII bacterium]|jgi:simple sugar transport system permease protein|nr:ABC transporter permease [Clostridiales Family XIII bacterium]
MSFPRLNFLTIDRDNITKSLFPVVGLLLSFIVCGAILPFFNINPFSTYASIFGRAFGTMNGLSETIGAAVPSVIVAIGIVFVIRVGIFNLGAEGQVMFGALGAQIAAVAFGSAPAPVAILLTLLGGMAFGAFWAFIPAILRVTLKVNEIVVCIMLNQVAIYAIGFLVRKPLKDPNDFNAQAVIIPENAWMPQFIENTKIHFGLAIALALIVFIAWVIKRTVFGFRVNVVGASERTAVYAGIPAWRTILLTFVIGGAISGIAGANEVMGIAHRLQATVSGNYGWTGITVAMIAKNNPFMLIIVSVLYSALQVGGLVIQITQHVPMELANIVQAMTVLFVLSSDFLYGKYRQRIDGHAGQSAKPKGELV